MLMSFVVAESTSPLTKARQSREANIDLKETIISILGFHGSKTV